MITTLKANNDITGTRKAQRARHNDKGETVNE